MGREDSATAATSTLAQQVVDGVVLPRPVAGHPALELCNTRAGWGEADPGEYLLSYRHLAALAHSTRLVTGTEARRLVAAAREEPAAAGRVLRQTLRFRQELYAVLTHDAGEVLDGVNAELRRAAAARRVERVTPNGTVWGFADQGLRAPLTAFAWAAYQFLDAEAAGSVRACPGHDCGWLFLDRRGQRRWCIMAICGNRAKARRHAARERAAVG
jgi:predicted RNA-binding Zn ribbon-like protein